MTCRTTFACSLAFTIVFAGLGATAHARESAEKRKAIREAKAELDAGDRAYSKGDYAGALQHYQQAHADFPSPKILYPIALAQTALGQHLAALQTLQEYIAKVPAREGGADYADAQKRLGDLQNQIGHITFVTHPDGANVTVNGNPEGTTPSSQPVLLEPGTYQVHFERPPYLPLDTTITVTAGEQQTEEHTLEYKKPASEPVENPIKKPPPPPPPPTGAAELYAGIGATGACVIGETVFGILALGEHSTFSDTHQSLAARRSAASSGQTDALVSDLFLGGAVISAGFTVYWYETHYHPNATGEAQPSDQESGSEDVTLAPSILPGGGSLSISGTF